MGSFIHSLIYSFIHLFIFSCSLATVAISLLGTGVAYPQGAHSLEETVKQEASTASTLSSMMAGHRVLCGGPRRDPGQLWSEAVRRGFLEEVMPELCFRGTFQADLGPALASGWQTVPRSLLEGRFLGEIADRNVRVGGGR